MRLPEREEARAQPGPVLRGPERRAAPGKAQARGPGPSLGPEVRPLDGRRPLATGPRPLRGKRKSARWSPAASGGARGTQEVRPPGKPSPRRPLRGKRESARRRARPSPRSSRPEARVLAVRYDSWESRVLRSYNTWDVPTRGNASRPILSNTMQHVGTHGKSDGLSLRSSSESVRMTGQISSVRSARSADSSTCVTNLAGAKEWREEKRRRRGARKRAGGGRWRARCASLGASISLSLLSSRAM